MKEVVVIGGGFAGLSAAKILANQPEVHVTLVDRRNHHLFQPLLYQVATAGLNPADIAVPIRAQFSKNANVEVRMSEVREIKLQEREVILSHGILKYEFLIVACGTQHSYFGKKEWEEFAPGLKTLEQATEIRRRILTAFEEAEKSDDKEKQTDLLTFIVVGGGPTGVEMAGAIADISRTVLVNDFKRINPASARVILIEAGPRLLPVFADELSQKAYSDLKELGVEIKVSSRVEKINAEGVQVGTELIKSHTVIWAAGVQASHLQFSPAVEVDRAGRVKVAQDFSIPGHKEVFVIGDMAAFEMEDKKPLPGLAPAAMQAGRYVAKNILNGLRGTATKAFQYKDKGQMATIGKSRAVGQMATMRFSGHLAWLAWLFIHIFYLIGFKNRLFVLSQWIWSYLFSKRGARLITQRDWK